MELVHQFGRPLAPDRWRRRRTALAPSRTARILIWVAVVGSLIGIVWSVVAALLTDS